jgi:hypothetical protein
MDKKIGRPVEAESVPPLAGSVATLESNDRVRRKEHKELLKQNNQRLTGSRQLWLYNPIKLKDERAKSSNA